MTDPTAAVILGQIGTWAGLAFNGLDAVHIWTFSILDILIAIALYDITVWGVMRVIDSNKSDD